MSSCPVDPAQVATATLKFVDLLECCGLLLPRADRDNPPENPPLDALSQALFALEFALNPARLVYPNDDRVRRVLAWEPTHPVTAIGVGVNTILRWWRWESMTTLRAPVFKGPRVRVALLPRLMAEQMRAAAIAVMTGARVEWLKPSRAPEPVTGATADDAAKAAGSALAAVEEIFKDLREHPEVNPAEDEKLFYDFHLMRTAAGAIPGRGWEAIYPPEGFRDYGLSDPCCHNAVIHLAQIVEAWFSHAACRATTVKWGTPPQCSPIPLTWVPEARPLLWESVQSRGEFDCSYWLMRVGSESARLKLESSRKAEVDWSDTLSRTTIGRRLGCNKDDALKRLEQFHIRWEVISANRIRVNLLDMTETMRKKFVG
jgi:hypothetical protein